MKLSFLLLSLLAAPAQAFVVPAQRSSVTTFLREQPDEEAAESSHEEIKAYRSQLSSNTERSNEKVSDRRGNMTVYKSASATQKRILFAVVSFPSLFYHHNNSPLKSS